MEIIAATPTDASILVALEHACFAGPWTLDTLAAALEDERYVVLLAREGVSTLGYVLGWSIAEEAELARVGVLPAYRGRGIARQLTRAIKGSFQACGAEVVFLEVRESNLAARRVYTNCGFVEVGQRRNYYADGETAIVMRAELC